MPPKSPIPVYLEGLPGDVLEASLTKTTACATSSAVPNLWSGTMSSLSLLTERSCHVGINKTGSNIR
jgi:hypothetical protein